MIRTFFVLVFCLFSILSFAQTAEEATPNPLDAKCLQAHKGKFKYLDIADSTSTVKFKKKKHIEYHQGKKYKIVSTLVWDDNCTYTLVMKKTNHPGFKEHIGSKMTVKIYAVRKDIIFYESNMGTETWMGRFKKI